MSSLLICRNCGARTTATLAVNEQELANLGMLERLCGRCARETQWGMAEDYRKRERRVADRRHGERRTRVQGPPPAGESRRGIERRISDMRKGERRRSEMED